MRAAKHHFLTHREGRKQRLVALDHWPPYLSKAQRVPGQGAPPLIAKQKMKHPRGRYSDLWLVCYSFFIPTTALVFTLLQSMCLLKDRGHLSLLKGDGTDLEEMREDVLWEG